MFTFEIAGRPVRALRHGMAGEPGFEFWGPWADHDAVIGRILEAGAQHGMIQVGGRAYHTNALESGWLPRPIPAIFDDPELADYRRWLNEEGARSYETTAPLGGSHYSEDIADHYFTPFETDYGRIVNFDHDFIGKDALQAMIASGESEARKKVTFVWDPTEAGNAYAASLFTPAGEGPKYINLPMSLYDTFHTDRVETADGTVVGRSQWVGYSANERTILSLGSVEAAYSTPGTELYLVWGEEPNSGKAQVEAHRQIRIKVLVEPAPLTDKARSSYRSNDGATV
jgi:syringate O-demethylase